MLFRTQRLLLPALLIAASAPQAQTPGQEQTPAPASRPGAGPLSYGLVVDNSGSLRASMDFVIAASKVVVDSNREGDEAFVVRFVSSEQIQVLTDLTRDRRRLARALDEMYVEGGATAVVDAVYLAADYIAKNVPDDGRPRALVLITDGEDRSSFYKSDELVRLLRDKKIRVYVLGFPEEIRRAKDGKQNYPKAVALLNALASETGGKAVLVERVQGLEDGAARLVKHIRDDN